MVSVFRGLDCGEANLSRCIPGIRLRHTQLYLRTKNMQSNKSRPQPESQQDHGMSLGVMFAACRALLQHEAISVRSRRDLLSWGVVGLRMQCRSDKARIADDVPRCGEELRDNTSGVEGAADLRQELNNILV